MEAKEPHMSEPDVIVSGNEIGGLGAALTCARVDRNVPMLEAAGQFGGFINPFSRKHHWFDTGIHYVGERGPGQLLHGQFEAVGLCDDLEFREIDLDRLEPTT
jgi:all-trans-retinol 13,14-reductase